MIICHTAITNLHILRNVTSFHFIPKGHRSANSPFVPALRLPQYPCHASQLSFPLNLRFCTCKKSKRTLHNNYK